MTAENMSPAVPEPVVEVPSGAPDASGVTGEQPLGQAAPTQAEPNAQEPSTEESQPEYVLRSVMDAERKEFEGKMQSAKDREIAEFKKHYSLPEATAPNQQPVSEGGKPDFSEAGLEQLIASEASTAQILRYQRDWMQADSAAELQKMQQQTSQKQEQQQQVASSVRQYEADFMALAQSPANPLTQDQLARAQQIAFESVDPQNGLPTVTPLQAIARAQFGDEATLLRYAAAGMGAGMDQHAEAQRTAATVPGGGRNSVPTGQAPAQSHSGTSRGSFRDWH